MSVEKKINIKIVGKLPITLEGAQLALNNAELNIEIVTNVWQLIALSYFH